MNALTATPITKEALGVFIASAHHLVPSGTVTLTQSFDHPRLCKIANYNAAKGGTTISWTVDGRLATNIDQALAWLNKPEGAVA
jgi:hypothetical protein